MIRIDVDWFQQFHNKMAEGKSKNRSDIYRMSREATIITIKEAEKETQCLERNIEVLEKNQEEYKEKPTKKSENKTDVRSLLLIFCLLTFEAELPEQFYDNLFRSDTMKEVLRHLKGEKFNDISMQELC